MFKNIFSLGVVFLFLILAIGSMEDDKPETLEKANDDITRVIEGGKGVRIDIYDKYYSDIGVYEMARAILDILKDIKNVWPDKYESIQFVVYTNSWDQYGNESVTMAMMLFYDMSEVHKINFDNMSEFRILNLATDVDFKPIGRELSLKYCSDQEYRKFSYVFCGRLMN